MAASDIDSKVSRLRASSLRQVKDAPLGLRRDLYAGMIVAALDRQHPRDLFDVRDLLAKEGVDDALRGAFLVYLANHNRPMAEVLAPTRKPLHEEFERGFAGDATAAQSR